MSGKDEILRRLRLGNLRTLFRDRYGPTLPNDDAGREDLHELLLPISIGPSADIKMPNTIEVWAPWLQPAEAAQLIDEINRTPIWRRKPSARQLGQRQRVTNGERERLKLWTIAPYNRNPQQMLAQRRAKDRERKRRKRQQTREQYLAANAASRDKPWLLMGMSRATYYRKRAKDKGETGPSAVKLKQHRNNLSQLNKPQVRLAVRATTGKEQTTERLPDKPCNRNHSDNKTRHLAAVSKCPECSSEQPVSPSDGVAGIGHNLGPPLDDDLAIPEFLRRELPAADK